MEQDIVQGFANQINRLSTFIGKTVSYLAVLMVGIMTLIVVLRYGFNLGWIWLQESVLYMHGFMLMLAMSYTLQLDQHVRVDVFYRKLSKRSQNRLNLFGHCVFLLPTCLFILFMSWDYVAQSWHVLEGSKEAGGLPLLFVLKSLLVIGPVLLIFQAVADCIQLLLGTEEQS